MWKQQIVSQIPNSHSQFTLIEKIFRQINSLVICLVYGLLSRNIFPKKHESKDPSFPHCEVAIMSQSFFREMI